MKQKRKLLVFFVCMVAMICITKIPVYAANDGTIVLEKGTKGTVNTLVQLSYGRKDYKSSNNSVFSVDQYGNFIAKKAGSARLKVYPDTNKSYKVKVVDKKITFKNTAITATRADVNKLADQLKLNVGMVDTSSSNNVAYVRSKVPISSVTSSNEAVIQVFVDKWDEYYGCEMEFYVYGTGTTTITAKVGNKVMKCKVNVIDPKLSETEVYKIVGNKTTLKVTGVKGKVKWKSENTAIATVDSKGVVTAKDLGTTYIDAIVQGTTLRCKFTTEPVPQFVNVYKMKGIGKVVLADTVLHTSSVRKFDTIINDEGKAETTYNWDVIGDITDVDYKDDATYPVYDIEKRPASSGEYNVTEIYLAGSSQNAVIKRLDSTIGGGTDVYCEYEPGNGMGTIRIYSKDCSPALYQVKIDGHELVFATKCREYWETKPTDKVERSSETAKYVKQNIGTFDVDSSGVMASIGKYIIDKTIETAVNAIVDKFFPW